MSLPPHLYRRKVAPVSVVEDAGPYIVTWSEGTMVKPFRSENGALFYANTSLRVVRGVLDARITGPDHDYLSCDCGCGRVFRDGDGCRIGNDVLHADCYGRHPVAVGATMAAILADEGRK